MKPFFSSRPLYADQAIGAIRIALGLLVIYHGLEVFDTGLMHEYAQWDSFKDRGGLVLAYIGKTAELVSGISLLLGLLTRLGALLLMGTLAYVTFFVGQGRFWYEDQHPFMFVLIGAIYLFYGSGAWSIDRKVFAEAH